jgi:hypothetical protein
VDLQEGVGVGGSLPGGGYLAAPIFYFLLYIRSTEMLGGRGGVSTNLGSTEAVGDGGAGGGLGWLDGFWAALSPS